MDMELNDNYTFDDYREVFHKILEEKKLNKTSERFNILREIFEIEGHFDADKLFQRLRSKKYTVSKTTIYKTLDLLESFQLIVKHHFGDKVALYEKCNTQHPHNHIFIENTEEIIEFHYDIPEQLIKTLEDKYKISISHHSLTLFGKKENENQHKLSSTPITHE